MVKIPLIILCLLSFAVPAHAQLDTTKWFALNNSPANSSGTWCRFSANVNVSGGFLTESLTNAGPYSCVGTTTATYASSMIVSTPFYFTGGVVKARIRLGSPGNPVTTALWMWGGASTSSGYPPTCIANLESNTGIPMAACTTSSVTSYEIDIAQSEAYGAAIDNNMYLWQSATVVTPFSNHVAIAPAIQNDYHIYELDWYPGVALVFKMDGLVTTTITSADVPSVPMFLIIDQEINVLPTSFPATTSVDWIRVCQDPVNPNTVMPACNYGDATTIFDDEFNAGVTPPTPVNHTLQGKTVQGVGVQ